MIDRSPIRAAAAAAACAAVLGCGAANGTGSAGEPAAFEPGDVRVATLTDVEAEIEARAGTPFLLNVWAIWCAPCVEELPDLHACKEAFADEGGDVLTISYDLMVPFEGSVEDKVGEVAAFLADREFTFDALVFDDESYDAINAAYDLPGPVPVTLAFDAGGEIVDRQTGKAGRERFDEMMRSALGGG